MLGTAAVQPSLLPGGATGAVASLDWVLPADAQPFTLLAVVNPQNTIAERTSTNNQAWIDMLQADLMPLGITTEQYPDGSVSLVCSVTNSGSWGASNVLVRFFSGTRDLGLKTIASLPAGELHQLNVALPAGTLAAGKPGII